MKNILKTGVSIIFLQILSLPFVDLILEEIFNCFESKLYMAWSFESYFFGENMFELN